jgi:hypothetical protein
MKTRVESSSRMGNMMRMCMCGVMCFAMPKMEPGRALLLLE